MRFRDVWNEEPLVRLGGFNRTIEASGNMRRYHVPPAGQTLIPRGLRDDPFTTARENSQFVDISAGHIRNPQDYAFIDELTDCDTELARQDIRGGVELLVNRSTIFYPLPRILDPAQLLTELDTMRRVFSDYGFAPCDLGYIYRGLTGEDLPETPLDAMSVTLQRVAARLRPFFTPALPEHRFLAVIQNIDRHFTTSTSMHQHINEMASRLQALDPSRSVTLSGHADRVDEMTDMLSRYMTPDEAYEVVIDMVARPAETFPGRRTPLSPLPPAPPPPRGVIIPTVHTGKRAIRFRGDDE